MASQRFVPVVEAWQANALNQESKHNKPPLYTGIWSMEIQRFVQGVEAWEANALHRELKHGKPSR